MDIEPAARALQRFVVIDLTVARAGPTCARQLADWGATVIRVEIPQSQGGHADFASRHDPDFQNLHRNKLSLTLNLKDPRGLDVFRELVKKADVLVENYRPGVKKRLGIDYETLHQVNPALVFTSISGFGQDGPYGHLAGVDQIAQGMGGLMSVTGLRDQGPVRAGIALADMAAGLLGTVGTLTALLDRQTTGKGQWVQTSLLESQIFMMDFQAARYLMKGEVAGQTGNDHPTSCPMGTFRTSDGYINVAPMPLRFREFATAIGHPELADDPDFAKPGTRLKNRSKVNARIQDILLADSSANWIGKFNHAGVPCGPIYTMDQTFQDPQVQHLGIAQTVRSDALGDISLVGQPVHLSGDTQRIVRSAPELGEHSELVLDWLGYSDADIAGLRRDQII